MKLTGILDNSLNGQLCLRGFANIKDLARISEADYSYQRGLLDRSDINAKFNGFKILVEQRHMLKS